MSNRRKICIGLSIFIAAAVAFPVLERFSFETTTKQRYDESVSQWKLASLETMSPEHYVHSVIMQYKDAVLGELSDNGYPDTSTRWSYYWKLVMLAESPEILLSDARDNNDVVDERLVSLDAYVLHNKNAVQRELYKVLDDLGTPEYISETIRVIESAKKDDNCAAVQLILDKSKIAARLRCERLGLASACDLDFKL